MRSLFWAFLERVVPRAAVSGLVFVLAVVQPPGVVGLYSWATTALALVQACTDSAARQVVLLHWGTPQVDRFVARYQPVAAVGGGLVLGGVAVVLAMVESHNRVQALMLAPLALVPAMWAWQLGPVAQLQLAGQWRALARFQATASLVSLVLTVPLVLLTRSLLPAALQICVATLLFTRAVRRSAAGRSHARPRDVRTSSLRREFAAALTLSIMGFAQGQGDRMAIGAFGGTALLGVYTTTTSVSRNLVSFAATSSEAILRADVAGLPDPSDDALRGVAERTLRRSAFVLAAFVVASVVVSETLLRHVLGAGWDEALDLVPLLAVSVLPLQVSLLVPALLQAKGQLRRAVWPQTATALAALPIGLAAGHGLTLAAWCVVGREVLGAVWMLVLARRAAPWRGAALVLVLTAGLLAAGEAWVRLAR